MFPSFKDLLSNYDDMIEWKKVGEKNRIPEPKVGISKEYDSANEEVETRKNKLNKYLESMKK